MQLKLSLIPLLCVFIISNISAQTTHIPVTIQNLLADNKPASYISWENRNYVNIADTPFKNFQQRLIKTSKGLFVSLDGSGRIYQLLSNNGNLEFKRIDSTIFFGYNLGSFPFAYHDTIYSLGGYGIWRINGQLRRYVDKARQWDVVGLNEEIPVMVDTHNSMMWYDYAKGKIYIGSSVQRNEAVRSSSLNETNFVYDVSVLDLTTKNWQKLGTLSNYLREKSALIGNITASPWGQLVGFGNKLMIIDYPNNRLLSLKAERNETITTTLFADPDTHLYYFKDSTLYFGNTAKNTLDSIQLRLSDFAASDEIVYTPVKNSSTITITIHEGWLYIIGGLIVLATAGLSVWRMKKSWSKKYLHARNEGLREIDTSKNTQTSNGIKELRVNGSLQNGNGKEINNLNGIKINGEHIKDELRNGKEHNISNGVKTIIEEGEQHINIEFKNANRNEMAKAYDVKAIFEERELQTLKLIYCNSSQGKTTSIEELNKVLGVMQKNIEIQKKQRSETIMSINKKYSLVNGKENSIIERRKTDYDKRSFEYFIEDINIEDVNKILNK